jgi:hypothetical protein
VKAIRRDPESMPQRRSDRANARATLTARRPSGARDNTQGIDALAILRDRRRVRSRVPMPQSSEPAPRRPSPIRSEGHRPTSLTIVGVYPLFQRHLVRAMVAGAVK